MTPLTSESLRSHPELMERLVENARRERAEAVDRLLIAPVQAAFRRLVARRPVSVRASLEHPACG